MEQENLTIIEDQPGDLKIAEPQQQFNFSQRFENNEYFQSKKIVIKLSSKEMGLGVFATEDIEKGELIERCPMIQLDWRTHYQKDPQIHAYVYTNSACQCDQCKMHGYHMFMVLGYGMLYNHQDDPNTNWQFNFRNLIADVIANKAIKKGEEIFVTYGSKYFSGGRKKIIKQ